MEPKARTPGHPLLAGVEAIEAALEEMTASNPVFLDAAAKRSLLVRLARLEARLTAVRLRTMAVADDVATAEGARDIAALLTCQTRGDGPAHRRELALAQAMDRRWGLVQSSLATGDLNVAQAQVIARAMEELPDDLDPEIRALAEAHLVAEAAHYGPRELRVLGRKIVEVIAPETFEDHEARQLIEEERRAQRRTSLVSTRLGDGTTRIAITVPDAVAARLHTYLEAFTAPRHLGGHLDGHLGGHLGIGETDRIPVDRRRGQAFCSLLEAVEPGRLPVHGGDATTLIVTVSLESLRHELGSGALGPAERLSAAQIRRLACTARIIPAVLGGKSEVLDLGRSSRLFRPAQRKAMVLRDRECRAEGCSIPAAWCEAHHAGRPWADGGRTDLADGVLLCSWHHHRAHDAAYDTRRMPSGDVRFNRRP